MPTRNAQTPSVSILRIVPCSRCGGRRRTLVDTAQGLRGHCMGCGAEIAFPFATERTPVVLGRGGQVVGGARLPAAVHLAASSPPAG